MAPHQDIELNTLNTLKLKEDSLAHGSSFSMREPDYNEQGAQPPTFFERVIDSFRRDPNSVLFPSDHLGHVESGGRVHNGAHYYDLHQASLETAHTPLARKLKGRHLQMIAIGGSIGTSGCK
jgi:amino acid transporter